MGGNPFTDRTARKSPEDGFCRAQKKFRCYAVIAAVLGVFVGTLIGRYGFAPESARSSAITPPPWDVACAAVADSDAVELTPTVTPEPLAVYVTGAVAHPGVVTVPAGSLVAAAVEAAGGALGDADLERLNLAEPLAPNQHLTVPRREEVAEVLSTAGPPVADILNINTATAKELESLPHVGPARAQQIVAYREEHGPFARKEDVQNVSGIGPATFADLEPYITVEP